MTSTLRPPSATTASGRPAANDSASEDVSTVGSAWTRWVFPCALIAVAILAAVQGLRLALGETSTTDAARGGWYLVCVAAVLAVATATGFLWNSPSTEAQPDAVEESDDHAFDPDQKDPNTDEVEPTSGASNAQIALCLALLFGYAALLPWIGFATTNAVFLYVYLRFVAHYGWLRSAVYTAAIDVATVLFFTQVGVLLPSGALGLFG